MGVNTSFTTFQNYPGTPNIPGAADLNRLQANDKFLAKPPACKLYMTPDRDASAVASNMTTWYKVYLNGLAYKTVSSMAPPLNDGDASTPGVIAPEAALFRADGHLRLDTDNQSGGRQARLGWRHASDGSIDYLDDDTPYPVQTGAGLTYSATFKLSAWVPMLAGDSVFMEWRHGGTGGQARTVDGQCWLSLHYYSSSP